MLRALPVARCWKIPTRTEANLNISQEYPNTRGTGGHDTGGCGKLLYNQQPGFGSH